MIVLDTHALVWWIGDGRRLSAAAKKAINAERNAFGIALSSISAWELANLVEHRRLELAMRVDDWLDQVEATGVVRFVPVDNKIAVDSVTLPGEFHRDPADRIIVATARRLGAPLVTADQKIRRYPHVRTIW